MLHLALCLLIPVSQFNIMNNRIQNVLAFRAITFKKSGFLNSKMPYGVCACVCVCEINSLELYSDVHQELLCVPLVIQLMKCALG